jgi:hypothetical protein
LGQIGQAGQGPSGGWTGLWPAGDQSTARRPGTWRLEPGRWCLPPVRER